ncbi:MAG: hypothetical protein VXW57_04230, partial [Pseudomonadota bacterium]|nr:hypothetical protein [Pseudomonadota bacterium]
MPHWMRHDMAMVGIDPANTGMGHGDMDHMSGDTGMGGMDHNHHSMAFGQTMSHSTQGFGDTLVSASYRLANTPAFKAHATLGVWAPTGKVDRKNANGTFVHYMMQSGSGTWDIEPSVTVAGQSGLIGWGAQASYRWRTDDENESGFAFGDKAQATGWLSYLVDSGFSLTSRITWEHEGQILGHTTGRTTMLRRRISRRITAGTRCWPASARMSPCRWVGPTARRSVSSSACRSIRT